MVLLWFMLLLACSSSMYSMQNELFEFRIAFCNNMINLAESIKSIIPNLPNEQENSKADRAYLDVTASTAKTMEKIVGTHSRIAKKLRESNRLNFDEKTFRELLTIMCSRSVIYKLCFDRMCERGYMYHSNYIHGMRSLENIQKIYKLVHERSEG